MKHKYFLIPLIATVLFVSCKKKEQEVPPLVITQLSPSAGFTGTRLNISTQNGPQDLSTATVRIGSSANVKPSEATYGYIQLDVPNDATTGKVQITVNGKTYSSTDDFTVLERSPIAITDFTPKSARPGTAITITGTGFGNDASLVDINFGQSGAIRPVSVTPTSIVVKTVEDTKDGKIKITRGGMTGTSSAEFKALPSPLPYQPLEITSFSADFFKPIQLGGTLTIYGGGFGNIQDLVTVTFVGGPPVKIKYLSSYGITLQVDIPRYAQKGKIKVTVDGNSVTSTTDISFGMSVRDYSPKAAAAGDTIKFVGEGFTSVNAMGVNFGNNGFTRPIKVTPTEMLAVVPISAATGMITVTTGSGATYDATDGLYGDDYKFTLIPTVSFSNYKLPSSGKIGDVIAINGEFQGADPTKIGVSFGGSKPVQPISITNQLTYVGDLNVKIPSDAKTGKITISRTGYKTATSSFTFTIVP